MYVFTPSCLRGKMLHVGFSLIACTQKNVTGGFGDGAFWWQTGKGTGKARTGRCCSTVLMKALNRSIRVSLDTKQACQFHISDGRGGIYSRDANKTTPNKREQTKENTDLSRDSVKPSRLEPPAAGIDERRTASFVARLHSSWRRTRKETARRPNERHLRPLPQPISPRAPNPGKESISAR